MGSVSGAVVATAVLLALGWQKPESAIGFLGTFVSLKLSVNWRQQRERQNDGGEQWRDTSAWVSVKLVMIWLFVCAGLALVFPLVAFFGLGLALGGGVLRRLNATVAGALLAGLAASLVVIPLLIFR